MNVNYQRQVEQLLGKLEGAPRLLLHACCGPCASYVLEYLDGHFDITVYAYNPNIRPYEEYEKRLQTLKDLLRRLPLSRPAALWEPGWREGDFLEAARGLEGEPEGGARCAACFALRLEQTARAAREGGFAYFGTTLTVSPHKDALLLNRIGQALEEKYGVAWLPSDFKKRGGYLRSIQLSKEYGLYRQNYCGCGWPERRAE